MNDVGIIYGIYHKESNRWYIGQTTYSLKHRWQGHISMMNSTDPQRGTTELYQAMRKFGIDAFEVIMIEENIPKEQLDEREKFYIEKYKAYTEDFNNTIGGKGIHGYKLLESLSPEKEQARRQHIKEALNSPEGNKRLCEANKRNLANPITREKIRQAVIARQTPEYRAKLSAKQKEIQNRPEQKALRSKLASGLVCINNGEVNKKVTPDEATKLIESGEWIKGFMPESRPPARPHTTQDLKKMMIARTQESVRAVSMTTGNTVKEFYSRHMAAEWVHDNIKPNTKISSIIARITFAINGMQGVSSAYGYIWENIPLLDAPDLAELDSWDAFKIDYKVDEAGDLVEE